MTHTHPSIKSQRKTNSASATEDRRNSCLYQIHHLPQPRSQVRYISSLQRTNTLIMTDKTSKSRVSEELEQLREKGLAKSHRGKFKDSGTFKVIHSLERVLCISNILSSWWVVSHYDDLRLHVLSSSPVPPAQTTQIHLGPLKKPKHIWILSESLKTSRRNQHHPPIYHRPISTIGILSIVKGS